MTYWNRDRDKGNEPFKCWCDDCFPVTLPPFWKTRSYSSLREAVQMRFETLEDAKAYLETQRGGLARYVETMTHRVTPDGYAWAPWKMGAPCESCGIQL